MQCDTVFKEAIDRTILWGKKKSISSRSKWSDSDQST